MFRRGSAFYIRRRECGRDKWRSLGSDYEEACRVLRALRRGEVTTRPKVRVSEAVAQWLKLYLATARNPKGQRLAKVRAGRYLEPFMGYRLLDKLTREDMRFYRLWLERDDSISQQTVAHILSDARCFFLWCLDAGLIDRSPVPRKL